ncbi:MAG: winged helix-turn-helix domain-containing protein [Bacteroidales bacterium]|nr:winged helix-turn-helix domain-containing protein [Bacteroidales bacterium]
MLQFQKELLEKVLSSQEFSGSEKYQKLLRYLVESTIEGNIPKEITIAFEVFEIDVKSDSASESNIRVYIHNLRKKLDSYYANEGKEDKIKIIIPKGRYKVEFQKVKEKKNVIKKRTILIGITILLIIIASNIIYLKYFTNTTTIINSNYSNHIWKNILDNERPVLIVIGDYYLMKDNTYPDRYRSIRDSRINSHFDMDTFLMENPDKKDNICDSKLTSLGKFSPIAIRFISRMFYNSGKDFKIILASDFNWQDLSGNNIIYIGSFKSLGMLKGLLKRSNFEFFIYPNELQFYNIVSDSLHHYYSSVSSVDNAYESDYSVITKIAATDDDSQMLFFISSRDIGLISTIEKLTNLETLTEFENKYFKKPVSTNYFEACFMTQGLHRNTVKIDLLQINYLDNPSPFEIPEQ